MEQDLTLYSQDGTAKFSLFSRQNACVPTAMKMQRDLMQTDTVTVDLNSAEPLAIDNGDYIQCFGRRYKVNQPPAPTREGARRLTYQITFEGPQYDLLDIHYHLPADAYGETYYANLTGHLAVLLWNIERIYPGVWSLDCPDGVADSDKYENITAQNKNCLAVLQELCETFGVEFSVDSSDGVHNVISIRRKVGTAIATPFAYGRGRGLYRLSRANVNNTGIVNRLYVYGSGENLPQGYPHNKLCLSGKDRLTSYVENTESQAAFGIKEGEKEHTDIKPERIGTVTALGADVLTFADTSGEEGTDTLPMFDLNAKDDAGNTLYLISGESAKVTFQTGNLAGYEFDVNRYDHETHTFRLNQFKDENGTLFPDEATAARRFAVGDKYIITGVRLPDTYVAQAQARLGEKAAEDLADVVQPKVSYKLSLDENYFIKQYPGAGASEVLHLGDTIHVTDDALGIDKQVRITAITRDLLRAHAYDITLSDTVVTSRTVRVLDAISTLQEAVSINTGFADPTKARRRLMATRELLSMVFDPEGNYYTDKIKPLSIETTMLAVGAQSTQFTLMGAAIEPNYGGDANAIKLSATALVHYGIQEDSVRTWSISEITKSGLTPTASYYIYCRCPRAGAQSGVWHLSSQPIRCEQDSRYYYFLVGVLHSVTTDTDGGRPARLVSLTYGSSTINGRFIKTGRIESSGGGDTYFDIDNGEIGGVIKFKSTDGTYKDTATLDTRTKELEDFVDVTLPEDLSELAEQIDGKIQTWSQETDPADNWGTNAAKATHKGDLWYKPSTQTLSRYETVEFTAGTQTVINYIWHTIENAQAQAAIDAVGAKCTVFTAQPVAPYKVGDLWLKDVDSNGRAASGLWRCITANNTAGAFEALDWVEAVYYDATQTVIDGGIVTAGTIQLANSSSRSIVAGITGGDGEVPLSQAADRVRIWAGASYGNRTSAPYRVLQDGTFYATAAHIEGEVNATSGTIGHWTLAAGKLYSQEKSDNGVTPAVELDGENGQIRAAGNVYLDKLGLRLRRDGYNMVNVANVSVGQYGSHLTETTTDRVTLPENGIVNVPSQAISTDWRAVDIYPGASTFHFGYLDEGSTINLKGCSVFFTVPTQSTSSAVGTVFAKAKAPSVVMELLRNGEVVATFQGEAVAQVQQGHAIVAAIDIDDTRVLTAAQAGDYTVRITSTNWYMYVSGGVLGSTSTLQTAPFTISTSLKYSIHRANYKRTLLGYDGMVSTWKDGYLFINNEIFEVRFGNNVFRISQGRGIQKSSNGGQTFTAL